MNKRKNQRPKTTVDPKSILAILLLVLVLVGPQLLLNPGRAGEFNFYGGPVLPLTSLSGGENLTVRRDVTLDFGIYEEPKDFYADEERVEVRDTYTLTNPTAENVTVELAWGFEACFDGEMPVITVDGEPAEAAVWPASNDDVSIHSADSFEAYSKILTENDFLTEAMAEPPEWDVPVKVYHFSNIVYEGDAYAPTMDVSYKLGETTNLWTRTYSTHGSEDGVQHLTFWPGEDAWIYVIGDDMVDMTIGGTKAKNLGGLYEFTEVDGMSYELETYESTFEECLREAARDYVYDWEEDPGPGVELVTPEMLYDGVMKLIVGNGGYQQPGGFHSMDTLFGGLYSSYRMIYWVFPVEIPAGGSVTVSGTYEKECSWNSANDRHGYDVATTLGTNLNIPEQTVTLANAHLVTIVKDGESQNFGFDLENGVTTVELDPAVERYFLDVIKVE